MKKSPIKLKNKIQNHNLYKKTIENRYLAIFLLILITWITYSYFSQGFVYDMTTQDLNGIISSLNSFGEWSKIAYIVFIIIEIIVAPIPSLILTVAASVSFGSLNAALLTIIGAAIGNIIVYIISRRYGYSYFNRLIGDGNKALFHKYSEKYGPLVLFVLRLNPITSSDLFSYLAGLIGMPFKRFFISTMLGIIPMIFVVAYFGEVVIKNNPFFKLLFIIIAISYIVLFAYLVLKASKNKVTTEIDKFKK